MPNNIRANHHPIDPTPSLTGRAGVGPLLLHNFKIAYRNLMKYKFQTLVSILALAVGMVTLAATHFVLRYYAPPAICDEPYYDRLYEMSFAKISSDKDVADKAGEGTQFDTFNVPITSDIHTALTSNGGMPGVEKLFYADMGWGHIETTITLPDSTKLLMTSVSKDVVPEYLNFRDIRSALTGEKIPVLNYGEAVLSETRAKLICGDQNPIGTKIEIEEMGADKHMHYATYTVRDVIRSCSELERIYNHIYLCGEHPGVPIESYSLDFNYEVVLQDGYTMAQLETEANNRLAPLGLKVRIRHADEALKEEIQGVMLTRTIVYLISSMVLLSALVGFLKMQIQLFQMRRREVALRTVHGASARSLFALLLTEIMITLTATLALALVLISWLENYSEQHLGDMFNQQGWVVNGHFETTLWLYGGIVLLSALVVWITLNRIRNANRGLAAGMHRNARHTLRNTMLGIQLLVCLVFLAGSVAFSQFIGLIKEQMNIPDNDEHYAECILIRPFTLQNDLALAEYLQTNPENIKRYIKDINFLNTFIEFDETPGAIDALDSEYFNTHFVADTAFLDFWQRPIKWFVPEEQRKECILLTEKLYGTLDSLEIIKNGSLTISHWQGIPPLPIGGTFATMPYKYDNNRFYEAWEVVALYELGNNIRADYIIEPEEGKYHEAMEQMKEVMHSINPLPVEPTVFNLRKEYTQQLLVFDNLQRGAWILSSICLIICLMGIWSTIALDTRSRQKEVALRKIHGAKRKDIALLFGRLYLWLIGVASVIMVPLLLLLNQFLKDWAVEEKIPQHLISPVMPIVLSIGITSIVILIVVSLHVRKVMKQKPAEIIAKE